jgi:hypothetical protein
MANKINSLSEEKFLSEEDKIWYRPSPEIKLVAKYFWPLEPVGRMQYLLKDG